MIKVVLVAASLLSAVGSIASPEQPSGQSVSLPATARKPYEDLRDTAAMWAQAGPASLSTGIVSKGDLIAWAPAIHTRTGRLRSPISFRGDSTGRPPLPAGTAVYGVLLNGGRLSWCAPYRNENPRAHEPRWEADCVVPALGYVAHAKAFDHGLFAERVRFVGHAEAADVAEGPVSFGETMRITYQFDGWRRGEALIRAYIEVNGRRGELPVDYASGRVQPDGIARVKIMGHELLVSALPDPDTAMVSATLAQQSRVGSASSGY